MDETVVVVDDEADIRFIVRMNLEAEGFHVVECANGAEAIEAIRRTKPAVVICDVMMPGTDGYGVLQAVREEPETAQTPFIFLTAKASDTEVWEGWKSGADYYLTKPFDPDELIKFMNFVLGGGDAEGPASPGQPPG